MMKSFGNNSLEFQMILVVFSDDGFGIFSIDHI